VRVANYAIATHAGRVRRKNEDAYYAEPPLFAVADGMGGALAGELASRIAVQALGELVAEGSDEERLASTVRLANRRVAERATSDPRASGMGSTVTAALIGARSVAFAHVGDSRAYLWRGAALTRLSDDHSLVAEWVKAGALAPEEAALHPQRSVITRALGADWQVEVDTWTTPVRAGDVILLCTDGLTGFVDEAAIGNALARNDDLDVAVHALVDAANAAGGEDNITAVAVRLEADDEAANAVPAGAVANDDRETGEIEVPGEPGTAPESTAVALAVASPPPVPHEAPEPGEPLPERPVPMPVS
jgi:serine/threonine protein phosphatase PrpC